MFTKLARNVTFPDGLLFQFDNNSVGEKKFDYWSTIDRDTRGMLTPEPVGVGWCLIGGETHIRMLVRVANSQRKSEMQLAELTTAPRMLQENNIFYSEFTRATFGNINIRWSVKDRMHRVFMTILQMVQEEQQHQPHKLLPESLNAKKRPEQKQPESEDGLEDSEVSQDEEDSDENTQLSLDEKQLNTRHKDGFCRNSECVRITQEYEASRKEVCQLKTDLLNLHKQFVQLTMKMYERGTKRSAKKTDSDEELPDVVSTNIAMKVCCDCTVQTVTSARAPRCTSCKKLHRAKQNEKDYQQRLAKKKPQV